MAQAAPLRFSEQGRSGTRMLVSMPVTLKGFGDDGKAYEEKARTVVVNRAGCKLATDRAFTAGAKFTLEIGAAKRVAAVTVVWVGDRKNKLLEVGVDFDAPDPGFWGVTFPEDNTAAPAAKIAPASAPAAVPAPSPVAVAPQAKAALPPGPKTLPPSRTTESTQPLESNPPPQPSVPSG